MNNVIRVLVLITVAICLLAGIGWQAKPPPGGANQAAPKLLPNAGKLAPVKWSPGSSGRVFKLSLPTGGPLVTGQADKVVAPRGGKDGTHTTPGRWQRALPASERFAPTGTDG